MGIQGLIPFLKKSSRAATIKEFKGCTVAIDSYCWLHRGAFSCAEKLAMGEATEQYVYYCMKFVNNLLSYGIKPIMVFDGCHLPSKKDVERSRRERREKHRKLAAQYMREGKRAEARDALTKCIDITPQMALNLMTACRDKGVDCIVAPYEADAQLAYLNKAGIAQVIVTEDSDLVLFGCDKIMFKMDFAGNGMLIERRRLNESLDLNADHYTFDKFRYMCILSGCDYLPSLPGIGLGKANKVFKLTRQTDMLQVLKKMPTLLKMGSLQVPMDYMEGFFRADNTFLYQLVFDPLTRDLVPLTPYPPEITPEDLHYAGPQIPRQKAYMIALGNIDLYSGKKIADFNPETFKPKSQSWQDSNPPSQNKPYMLSIWDKRYRPMGAVREQAPVAVARPATRGKETTVAAPTRPPKIRSPLKRRREEAEEDLTPSDLLAMYGGQDADTGHHGNPPDKKSRTSMENPLTAHPEKGDTKLGLLDCRRSEPVTATDPGNAVGDADPRTENPGLEDSSPSRERNRFAVRSYSGKKDRFTLHAKKVEAEKTQQEVRSRFFQSKKPLKPTNFFHQLTTVKKEELEDDGDKEDAEESEEAADGDGDAEDTVNGSAISHNAGELLPLNQSLISSPGIRGEGILKGIPLSPSQARVSSQASSGRESPYGSFGFRKLNKFKSRFDSKGAESSVKRKSAVSEAFITVLPTAGTVGYLKVNGEPLMTSTQLPGTDAAAAAWCEGDTLSGQGTPGSSQQSGPLYSLDSYCLNVSDDADVDSPLTTCLSITTREEQPAALSRLGDQHSTSAPALTNTSSSSAKLVDNSSQPLLNKRDSLSAIFGRDQRPAKPKFYLSSQDLSDVSGADESVIQNDSDVISLDMTEDGSFSAGNPNRKAQSFNATGSGSGCRTSGLPRSASRGRGHVTRGKRRSDENQPTLSSYFSSFSYAKRSAEKPALSRQPLSLSPDKTNTLKDRDARDSAGAHRKLALN